jgi:CRP-like cAMP-binding protein
MTFGYAPKSDDARPDPGWNEIIFAMGARVPFSKGEEIFSQGEAADLIYELVSGTVRLTRFTATGHQTIDRFSDPGALFGLDPGPEHPASAEALTDCVVLVVSRRGLTLAAGSARLSAFLESEAERLGVRTEERAN